MEREELLSLAIDCCNRVYGPERTDGETINDAANFFGADYETYLFLFDALKAYFSIAY